MPIKKDKDSLLAFYKRRQKKTLTDLKLMIESELLGIEDDNYQPSSAVNTQAILMIENANCILVLQEIEK